jgi:hypothetical protein
VKNPLRIAVGFVLDLFEKVVNQPSTRSKARAKAAHDAFRNGTGWEDEPTPQSDVKPIDTSDIDMETTAERPSAKRKKFLQ